MMILYYGLAVYVGMMIGFFIGMWLRRKFQNYTGTIVISKDMEKTVYLLELDDYPDEIRFKKEVVFRVDSSGWVKVEHPDKSPDRK